MLWYIVSSISMALAGIFIYAYYLRRGQFEDVEEVKYQLFRDDNKP